MTTSRSSTVLSAALAIGASDPDVGLLRLQEGWSGEVTPMPGGDSDRVLRLTSPTGREVVLQRFAPVQTRPATYPASIAFLVDHVVWAGASDLGALAVWIRPMDPALAAAAIVSESVHAGWELESSTNTAGPFGLAALKSVSLTQQNTRRSISIMSGHVTLLDSEVGPNSTP